MVYCYPFQNCYPIFLVIPDISCHVFIVQKKNKNRITIGIFTSLRIVETVLSHLQ